MIREEARKIATNLLLFRHGLSVANTQDMEALTTTIFDAYEQGRRDAGGKLAPGTIERFRDGDLDVTYCH